MKGGTARKLQQIPPGYLLVGIDPHKKRHAESDALQERPGHRDINTTRIYLRLSDEDVKRKVAKVLL